MTTVPAMEAPTVEKPDEKAGGGSGEPAGGSPTSKGEKPDDLAPLVAPLLERMASELPDLRKERVESLKGAIQDGRYEAPAEQVSSAMLRDALARGDLFRR